MKPITAQVIVFLAFLAFTVAAITLHWGTAWAVASFIFGLFALAGGSEK